MSTFSRLQQAVARAGVRLFVFMIVLAVFDIVAAGRVPSLWKRMGLDAQSPASAPSILLVLTIFAVWSLSLPSKSRAGSESSFWIDALRFVKFIAILGFTTWVGTLVVDPRYMRTGLEFVALIVAFELVKTLIGSLFRVAFSDNAPKRALILGSGRRASKAWREIRLHHRSSVELVGFVDDRNPETMAPDITNRLLCNLDELRDVIISRKIDRIYIAMPLRSCYDNIQRAIDVAASLGVRVLCMEDVYTTTDKQMVVTNELFRDLVSKEQRWTAFRFIKRFLDIIGAILGLIVFLPSGCLIALRIKSSSGGPIFVSDERLGLNGRRFKMLKFRTFALPKDGQAAASDLDAGDDESRTTPLGSMLRATSLDELGQFWNVLKGEMSLVGPRPMSLGDAVHASNPEIQERLRVKPGMTGLWQVSGRSTLNRTQSVAIDTRYIKEKSLRLDLAILLRTIPAVAKKTGAA